MTPELSGGVGGPWLLLGAPGPPTSPPAPLDAEDAPWCLLLSREEPEAPRPRGRVQAACPRLLKKKPKTENEDKKNGPMRLS